MGVHLRGDIGGRLLAVGGRRAGIIGRRAQAAIGHVRRAPIVGAAPVGGGVHGGRRPVDRHHRIGIAHRAAHAAGGLIQRLPRRHAVNRQNQAARFHNEIRHAHIARRIRGLQAVDLLIYTTPVHQIEARPCVRPCRTD